MLKILVLNPLKLSSLFLFSYLLSFPALAANTDCEALLQSIKGSYMHYVEKAEKKRGSYVARQPEFLNPQKEKELSSQWVGEDAPKLLAPYLPPGVTFVGHQLRLASAPGVVKVEQPNADFLILRVEMEFKGRKIATNVTINAQALYQNLNRYRKGEPLWLIGPDATAAMDWGHGGGTKTTGGHTADTLMNYMQKYNVFTMGMDQPFHGEGPREWFENEMEYFEFRVAFRNKFIHPDVPTFMIGHSYGGLIGDMAVRRSGEKYEKLGLKKAYAGIIPLSFVSDPAPGKSLREKTLREHLAETERKYIENEKRVNEEDVTMMANLRSKDKCSALSGLACSQLGLFNNWVLDENMRDDSMFLDQFVRALAPGELDKGYASVFQKFLEANPDDLEDGPVPSLYFMGEHDALYVLNEENIETYVRRLKNSILWTVASRVTFRGDIENVGHMIFDHYMPKKDHPEALAAMVDYLKQMDAGLEIPENEMAVQDLFKEKVLASHVQPYAFKTPVNNYSSSMVVMAFQWVPEFKEFLNKRIETLSKDSKKSLKDFKADYFIGYSDKGVFETYQIIRDFVSAVLKTKGKDLKELTSGDRIQMAVEDNDPMAKSREAVLSVIKAYGNNLAFREFLDDTTVTEIGATQRFQSLNDVGQALNQRQKMIETIKKEKISDDDKTKKIVALGSIENDRGEMLEPLDFEGLKVAAERVHLIRTKKYVPDDENRDFALQNIKRRDELQVQAKTLEKTRDGLRDSLKKLRDELHQKENSLDSALRDASSTVLKDLEAKRVKLFDELEVYDLKQRDELETFVAEVHEAGKSWIESFDNLPPHLLQLFIDTEKASKAYQAVLAEIDAAQISEAMSGSLGPDIQALAQSIGGPQGLRQAVHELNDKVETLEYKEIAALKEESEALMQAYVEKIVPEFFYVQPVRIKDLLNRENSSPEQYREDFKALEKALAMWRAKVLSSKPSGEAIGLY